MRQPIRASDGAVVYPQYFAPIIDFDGESPAAGSGVSQRGEGTKAVEEAIPPDGVVERRHDLVDVIHPQNVGAIGGLGIGGRLQFDDDVLDEPEQPLAFIEPKDGSIGDAGNRSRVERPRHIGEAVLSIGFLKKLAAVSDLDGRGRISSGRVSDHGKRANIRQCAAAAVQKQSKQD